MMLLRVLTHYIYKLIHTDSSEARICLHMIIYYKVVPTSCIPLAWNVHTRFVLCLVVTCQWIQGLCLVHSSISPGGFHILFHMVSQPLQKCEEQMNKELIQEKVMLSLSSGVSSYPMNQ